MNKQHPDHASICALRTANEPALVAAFTQELIPHAQPADAQETKTPGLDIPAELRRRERRVAALQRARFVLGITANVEGRAGK